MRNAKRNEAKYTFMECNGHISLHTLQLSCKNDISRTPPSSPVATMPIAHLHPSSHLKNGSFFFPVFSNLGHDGLWLLDAPAHELLQTIPSKEILHVIGFVHKCPSYLSLIPSIAMSLLEAGGSSKTRSPLCSRKISSNITTCPIFLTSAHWEWM